MLIILLTLSLFWQLCGFSGKRLLEDAWTSFLEIAGAACLAASLNPAEETKPRCSSICYHYDMKFLSCIRVCTSDWLDAENLTCVEYRRRTLSFVHCPKLRALNRNSKMYFQFINEIFKRLPS